MGEAENNNCYSTYNKKVITDSDAALRATRKARDASCIDFCSSKSSADTCAAVTGCEFTSGLCVRSAASISAQSDCDDLETSETCATKESNGCLWSNLPYYGDNGVGGKLPWYVQGHCAVRRLPNNACAMLCDLTPSPPAYPLTGQCIPPVRTLRVLGEWPLPCRAPPQPL